MNFKVEKKDGYSVVTMLAERLDAHTTPELTSEVVILAGKQERNMIIDLTACNYCDTAGLSAIQIAHRLCKDDGMLVLVGTQASVMNMLQIQLFDPPLVMAANLQEGAARVMKNGE